MVDVKKLIAFLLTGTFISFLIFMCIVTSQQVEILIYAPSTAKGLVIYCTEASTGTTYPCLLCLPVNMTLLPEKPRKAVWQCMLNMSYISYFTHRDIVDRETTLMITLPRTGLDIVHMSAGKNIVYIGKISVPVLALDVADISKRKIGEYTEIEEIELRHVLAVPDTVHNFINQLWTGTVKASSLDLASNLGYIVFTPSRKFKIVEVTYRGEIYADLDRPSYVLLIFTRYVENPLDRFFQWLSKTVGLSQPYVVKLPESRLVLEKYDFLINITVSYVRENKTLYSYVTYRILNYTTHCLTDICYVAYLAPSLYPPLTYMQVNMSGTAVARSRTYMINQVPYRLVELYGNSVSIMNSTPTLVVTMSTVENIPKFSTYLNVTHIPYTGWYLAQLLYVPQRSYRPELRDLGTSTFSADSGKLSQYINKSYKTLDELLDDIGIHGDFKTYVEMVITSDLTNRYGKDWEVVNVTILDAEYVKTVIKYRAEVYIPGDVDKLIIAIPYTCSKNTCTLTVKIAPT